MIYVGCGTGNYLVALSEYVNWQSDGAGLERENAEESDRENCSLSEECCCNVGGI